MPHPTEAQALEFAEKIRKIDDKLGLYSDHEGDHGAPVMHFWSKGKSRFESHILRAIADHREAVRIWSTMLRELRG